MRNILLLLVLVCGLVAGYFIGSYSGKDARETLADEIKKGKLLDDELTKANEQLKQELEAVNDKHKLEIDTLRKDYDAKKGEWQHSKAALDETIKRLSGDLGKHKTTLADLKKKLGASTSEADKKRLQAEIDRLNQVIAAGQQELDGNLCLKVKVPQRVLDALGS